MKFDSKNAVVIGGAGFVGSHLVDALLAAGANVTVVDQISLVGTRNIDHVKDSVNVIDCNVAEDDLGRLGKDINYIFHLAALAVPSACEKNPDAAFKTNVFGTFRVLRYAHEIGVEKLVFPSSAQLYGRYPKYLPIDEQHPIEISGSVYNATKKIGEELCNLFYEKHGMPIIFFRLFNCFGPRQAADYLIPTIITQALDKKNIDLWNEKPTRDFTYVEDTVRALMLGAATTHCGGPINVGTGREIATGDIAKQIAGRLGAGLNFQNKEVSGCMRMCCDNRRAKAVLGWEPKVTFEDGLDRTVDWFTSQKKQV
jgi:dTDP-glucose 4,6-dehydratase